MSIQGDGSWSVSWPYPQVRFTDYYTLGLAVDGLNLKVYELLNDSDVWTASEVASLGAVANIDFVDVQGWGPYYIVTASKIIAGTLTTTGFERLPNGSVLDFPTVAVPNFSTVCSFNGQPIISGIQSSEAPWSSLSLADVAWAGIGSGFDFRPTERGNETSGFIQLPTTGEGTGRTHKVMQLGNMVMAYGEIGVYGLHPHNVGRGGFGRVDYEQPGIISGNHIAGSENVHLYLNTENELVLVTNDMKFEVLGYQEFMETLTNNEIRISYVPSKKLFYISDSSTGYVLTEQGLYTCHQCVTSAGFYRGSFLCGFYVDTEDREPRFTTDTLDFEARGFKTLVSVQSDVRSNALFYSSCLFRSNVTAAKDAFTQSTWVRHNLEGISTLMVTANEFRVRGKGVDYTTDDWNIGRLDLRIKLVDKRGIRGLSNVSSTTA